MRANEFIFEAETPLRDDQKNAQQNVHRMRDVGGYDRVYHMNRMMMATAVADGKSTKAIDVPTSSWSEKYNTAHPYTDVEYNMVKAALNTIPSEHNSLSDDYKSRELDDVHKASPVPHNSGKVTKRKS
jgi:hypothetical protein